MRAFFFKYIREGEREHVHRWGGAEGKNLQTDSPAEHRALCGAGFHDPHHDLSPNQLLCLRTEPPMGPKGLFKKTIINYYSNANCSLTFYKVTSSNAKKCLVKLDI